MGKAIQSLAYKMQTVEELQEYLDGLSTDAVEAQVVCCHMLSFLPYNPLFTSISRCTRLRASTEFHLLLPVTAPACPRAHDPRAPSSTVRSYTPICA
jgi:hypothetical protein